MLELQDVIADRLEAEGRILAEAVAEHVLLCFRSQDPLGFPRAGGARTH
jgi:hypothetical protein